MLSVAYFFSISKYGQNCWEMLHGNYIEADEANRRNAVANDVIHEIINEPAGGNLAMASSANRNETSERREVIAGESSSTSHYS